MSVVEDTISVSLNRGEIYPIYFSENIQNSSQEPNLRGRRISWFIMLSNFGDVKAFLATFSSLSNFSVRPCRSLGQEVVSTSNRSSTSGLKSWR